MTTWTHVVTGDARIAGTRLESTVRFLANGDPEDPNSFTQSFQYSSPDELKAQVVDRLTALDTPPTPVPPGTVFDLPVSDKKPPTADELAKAKFFADLRAKDQEAKFAALPDDLKARCLPDYVSDL